MRIAIFDIDGVIFEHKSHSIEKNYSIHSNALVDNLPIQKTIDLIISLNPSTRIILLTDKLESDRSTVENRLAIHHVPYDELWMKSISGDSVTDKYKINTLKSKLSNDLLDCIVGIYDADEINVAAFLMMGLPAFLVLP